MMTFEEYGDGLRTPVEAAPLDCIVYRKCGDTRGISWIEYLSREPGSMWTKDKAKALRFTERNARMIVCDFDFARWTKVD